MLVVEDDGVIARAIAAHLRHAGLDVVLAEDGDKGLRKLRYEQHDVAVVDLMLPGVDGWALTQEARRDGITIPILIVSARSSEHDKVHALEIGADDYLAKPFGMRELVARVQALLRRTRVGEPGESLEPIDAPGLQIDPAGRRAFLVDAAGERARRRADADRVPAAAHARTAAWPRARPRRAAAARVERPLPLARSLGRRVRAQAAREARPALHAFLHPDAVRRRLPLRSDAAGREPSEAVSSGHGNRHRRPTPHRGRRRRPHARAQPARAPQRALAGAAARSARRARGDGRRHLGARRDRARRGAGVLRRTRPVRDDGLLAGERARAVRHLQRADDGDPPPPAARDRAGARHRDGRGLSARRSLRPRGRERGCPLRHAGRAHRPLLLDADGRGLARRSGASARSRCCSPAS